jgi:putative alpha-1,2-mannosidase
VYALGSPLFDRATVRLENGKTFTVEGVRKSPSGIYVQSATLNGRPLNRAWIRHSEIVNGGTLRFQLGPEPNKNWGAGGMPTP